MRAQISQSCQHLLLEWFTGRREVLEDKLFKSLLREIEATEQVKELVCNCRFAIQASD